VSEQLADIKIELVSTKPPVVLNEDVIRILHDVLEEAKRGEITDIGVCWVRPNGEAGNDFGYNRNKLIALIGSASVLCRDLLDSGLTIRESDTSN